MTREEARAQAEKIVYVYSTLGDILYRCEMAGIKTHTPKGKRISRTLLEEKLIDFYTEYYSKDAE